MSTDQLPAVRLPVALHTEGVDRNLTAKKKKYLEVGRPPHGGRG